MTKRSSKFKRMKHDAYFTPPEAVVPLLPHLGDVTGYAEPCYGEGHLEIALDLYINDPLLPCRWGSDISIDECDATSFNYLAEWATDHLGPISHFITNPPWTREILHPIIENLSRQLPTWLLLDADWMHTKQAIPYMANCEKVVSIGRVSWMQNGVSGFDNCCWYLFDKTACQTEFYARVA